MNDASDIKSVLKGIDPEQIPLPDGLEERLWDQIETKSESLELLAQNPGEPIVPSLESDEESSSPGGFQSIIPWAAVLVLVAVLGIVATQFANNSTTTELASARADSAGLVEESAPLSPDVGSEDLGFRLPPVVSQAAQTSLTVEFVTTEESVYNATIWDGEQVVATTGGSAIAGEMVEVLFEDLDDSTRYEVEVVLIGPPAIRSGRIITQTAGDIPLEVTNLELVSSDGPIRVAFSTNLCALSSYVVLTADQRLEVARANDASGDVCSTSHEVTLDVASSTAPGSDFLVIIEALGVDGGAATASLTLSLDSDD